MIYEGDAPVDSHCADGSVLILPGGVAFLDGLGDDRPVHGQLFHPNSNGVVDRVCNDCQRRDYVSLANASDFKGMTWIQHTEIDAASKVAVLA